LQHDEAELRWTNAGAFSDAGRYREFLTTMLVVHRRYGASAAARDAKATAIEAERIRALCADLASPIGDAAPSDPVAMGSDFAWGVLYVLNGSAMGASILLNQKVMAPSLPTSYLETMRGYAQSGSLGAFFRALNEARLDMSRAAKGADAVFSAISEMQTHPRG
ncbi:MAG: hypothetical protein AAF360_14485, partial [Pseudomonadota bacterium]